MAKKPYSLGDLGPYRPDRTFGQLLEWHLKWGTRPDCSLTEPNIPWVELTFADFVHGGTVELSSAQKNLGNWKTGKLPDPKNDADRIDRIFQELFGTDQDLRAWKEDLYNALERGRAEQEARIARRPVVIPSVVPAPVHHFLGRDREVATLAKLLASPEGPGAVLVLGGPGIGKTEMTKAVAHHKDVAQRFSDRRWFVPLEMATTADALQDAIARALGCDPRKDFQAVLDSLRNRQTLLVLDNLETPWEPIAERRATEQTLAALGALSGLIMLASFRGSEYVGEPHWVEHRLQELSHVHTTELFAAIAGEWVLDDRHLGNFTKALGGIPLAIELVARRAHGHRSLAPLWLEWVRIGTDLAKHPDYAEGRLTSLPHSIELSLRSSRMTIPAMRLFRMLGHCPAGLSADDCDALIGEDAFEAGERLLRLGLAVDREGDFDLLPPIREYAARNYQPEGGDQNRWADYFLENAPKSVAYMGFAARSGATAHVEFENIEAAFRAKIRHGRLDDVRDAFDAFSQITIVESRSTTIYDELASAFRNIDDELSEATCVKMSGRVALARSNLGAAEAAFLAAVPLFQKAGDGLSEANCMVGLGDIALYRSDLQTAEQAYKNALKLLQDCGGDVQGEANCMVNLGNIAFARSQYQAAQEAYEYALSPLRQINDVLGEANCLSSLANIALRRGYNDEAIELYKKSRALYEKIDHTLGIANCLKSLGDVALNRSDYSSARIHFEQALTFFSEVGDSLGQANCRYSMGFVEFHSAQYERAESNFTQAIKTFQNAENPLGEAGCLLGLGDIAARLCNYELARMRYENARSGYKRIGSILGEANCLSYLGSLELLLADYTGAEEFYREASALYSEIGDALGQANCTRNLGAIAIARMDYDQAIVAYEKSLKSYQQMGDSLGEANCWRGLGSAYLGKMDIEGARNYCTRALVAYHKNGSILGQANCARDLGDIELACAAYEAAQAAYDQAQSFFIQIGSVRGQAICIEKKGDVHLALSDFASAKAAFKAALTLFEQIGYKAGEAACIEKIEANGLSDLPR